VSALNKLQSKGKAYLANSKPEFRTAAPTNPAQLRGPGLRALGESDKTREPNTAMIASCRENIKINTLLPL